MTAYVKIIANTWAMLLPQQEWLTCVGRIAFPLFAFCIAEGCKRTKDRKKYFLRLLLFALVSEIPFDLMYSGTFFYPFHQNVLWTFLISIATIELIEKIKNKFPLKVLLFLLSYLLGYVLMTDYYGVGVIMVILFYFIPNEGWKFKLLQLAVMYFLNVKLLGGYYYDINVFGKNFYFVQQGFALISLIPIWLYKGKQGYTSKPFKYFCYSFYPIHMLILVLIRNIII